MGALPRKPLLLTSYSQLPFHTLGSSKAKGWASPSLGLWASHRLDLPGMSPTPSSWPSLLLALLSGSFPCEPFPDTSFVAIPLGQDSSVCSVMDLFTHLTDTEPLEAGRGLGFRKLLAASD